MPQRILCPIDFSDCSQAALNHASQQALRTGAKLFVVHVESPGRPSLPGSPGYLPELDGHRQLLDAPVPDAERLAIERHCLRGHVIDEIQRFARLREIDQIVMGTHGRSGWARALLGSVAQSLSNDPPCEVVTVAVTAETACEAPPIDERPRRPGGDLLA